MRDAPAIHEDDLPPDIEDLHGLEIDQPALASLGAIVKTSRQAEQLVYDILTKIDRGDVHETQYDFVLGLDAIPNVADPTTGRRLKRRSRVSKPSILTGPFASAIGAFKLSNDPA
ncbi:MAG: hypothetical protein ACJ8DL_10800 [Microvirga sp.]